EVVHSPASLRSSRSRASLPLRLWASVALPKRVSWICSCSRQSSSSRYTTSGTTLLSVIHLLLGGLVCQQVEDHRRRVVFLDVSGKPLDEVAGRRRLEAGHLLGAIGLLPVPVLVLEGTARHQLGQPRDELPLVRDVQWEQQVEAGLALLGVPLHSGREVRPHPAVLGDEPLRLRGGPDLGGRAPHEAELVPDAVWASSVVAWVHRHDFGGHPLITADLGRDLVANPKFKNHNPTLSFR